MSKKHTESLVSRRDALKKIGQCAEYTGAVVAFLTVSTPSWASAGTGTKPGCGGISGSIESNLVNAEACLEVDISSSKGASTSNTGISTFGQAGNSSRSSTMAEGSVDNSVSLKIDNSFDSQTSIGPKYQ